MQITLELALAERLTDHLMTVLASNESVLVYDLHQKGQAQDDLAELVQLVWEAQWPDSE